MAWNLGRRVSCARLLSKQEGNFLLAPGAAPGEGGREAAGAGGGGAGVGVDLVAPGGVHRVPHHGRHRGAGRQASLGGV